MMSGGLPHHMQQQQRQHMQHEWEQQQRPWQQQGMPIGPSGIDGSRRGSGREVRFGEESHGAGGYPAGMHQYDFNQPQNVTGGQAEGSTQSSDQLSRELDLYAQVASPEHSQKITDVLAEVLSVCEQACYPGRGGKEAGQLLRIGAVALGALSTSQGDCGDCVDVVYVAPTSVQLAELHAIINDMLCRKQGVSGVVPVGPDGHLAALGLKFNSRSIDVRLLISQKIPNLPRPTPAGIAQNIAGMLAWEVSEKLLSMVPNVNQFRLLLRFVRFWARQRGVYGSHLGFFGGTAWAICCARVCQMHPYEEISPLVMCFFRFLTRWDWRHPMALLAPDGTDIAAAVDQGAYAANNGETHGNMIVHLPVGVGLQPRQHVTDTTMKIMQKELRRGYKIVQQVELNRARWTEVYAMSRFFHRHRHYLELDFMAANEEVLTKWLAWAEPQLIKLVPLFESSTSNIVTLRPWPDIMEFKDPEWPCARAVFIGLHLERAGEADTGEGGKKSFDLREPIFRFLEATSQWPDSQKYSNQFELLIRHVRHQELERWLDSKRKGIPVGREDRNLPDGMQDGLGHTARAGWDTSGIAEGMQCSL